MALLLPSSESFMSSLDETSSTSSVARIVTRYKFPLAGKTYKWQFDNQSF